MRLRVVTPAPRGSRTGNRVTALRWACRLRELGHRVVVEERWLGGACDVLVVLHALRGADSVERYREARPAGALVVALTGTDVYPDLSVSERALRCAMAATRLVVLQPAALGAVPLGLRSKARVVLQSAPRVPARASPAEVFQVCVLAHLRAVKDPLRAEAATRLLPGASRVRVDHAGAELDPELGRRARQAAKSNPRYRWWGDLRRERALALLASSRLLVLSSVLEGGANVVSEAIAAGVPVLASRVPGSVGLLGEDYPGYFSPGDTAALAALLDRAERDPDFYGDLRARILELAPRFTPEQEREAWRALLAELG